MPKLTTRLLILGVALWLPSLSAKAESVAFDSDRWQIRASESEVVEYLGRQSLRLVDGMAWLGDVEILDGVVEFDIAFPEQRGFTGGMWRVVDRGNFEEFYLRPHQSGRADANQYTPAFDGLTCWQLYHGPAYSAPTVYPYNEWIHVRIVYQGSRAEIFIDSDEPVVVVPEQKREPVAGGVGVNAFTVPAYFSRFSYRPLGDTRLTADVPELPAAPENSIMAWSVSNVFDAARVLDALSVPDDLADDLRWTTLEAESTGIANLGRISSIGEDLNTVFAAVTVHSDEAQVARLRFGYSDSARVFLNGRLLYSGSNLYRSRDFRYLGTIGLFDGLPLALDEGQNQIWIAVSENFGGWGVQATLEAPSPVRLEPSGE